jgi:hypothetical protein
MNATVATPASEDVALQLIKSIKETPLVHVPAGQCSHMQAVAARLRKMAVPFIELCTGSEDEIGKVMDLVLGDRNSMGITVISMPESVAADAGLVDWLLSQDAHLFICQQS